MKQTVRLLGLCALVALTATSCQKNELTNTLTATLTQPTCENKTHINSNNDLVWDTGDQILVIDEALNTYLYTATGNGTTTTFTGNGALDPNNYYSAIYPASLVTGTDPSNNNRITFNIPDHQTYVEGSFATNTYPVAATNSGNGTTFNFQGLFGILAVPLTGSGTITSIQYIDNYFNVAGTQTLIYSTIVESKAFFPPHDSKSGTHTNMITLDCGDGLVLSTDPKMVMFVLRPLAGTYGFHLVINYNDGRVLDIPAEAHQNNAIRPQTITLMPSLDLDAYRD